MPTWIKLVNFMCPACPNIKEGHDWICAKDNQSMWLNELGRIKCLDGTHEGDIINCTWKCGSVNHNGEFLKADPEGYNTALSQAVQLMTKGGPEWVSQLVLSLGKQYKQISFNLDSTQGNSMLCTVCYIEKKNTVLIPCGHVFCNFCAGRFEGGGNNCPICRKPIEKFQNMFL